PQLAPARTFALQRQGSPGVPTKQLRGEHDALPEASVLPSLFAATSAPAATTFAPRIAPTQPTRLPPLRAGAPPPPGCSAALGAARATPVSGAAARWGCSSPVSRVRGVLPPGIV